MWNWSACFALVIVFTVSYLLFFTGKPSGAKGKNKASKPAKVDLVKATPKSSAKPGKKPKAAKKESNSKKTESEAAPVAATPVEAEVSTDSVATTPKSKKNKKEAVVLSSEKSVVETPAPTPELIPDHAEPTASETKETSSKSKKKKNKKSQATTEEPAAAIVTETILLEEDPIETFDPTFSKPTKVSVARVLGKGASERKPIETSNPWAVLEGTDY